MILKNLCSCPLTKRHRMSARHPMSEIPLFDEMRLGKTAPPLPPKDIGCF